MNKYVDVDKFAEEVRHGQSVVFNPRRTGRNATYKCRVCKKLCSSYYNEIDDLRAIADFYHREAEKNLRLLNEARGVIWHSVEDELPSENGTYLVVGKSGTVCTAHFYKEFTLHGKTYHWHFSNRYVRFWAKLPEPPVPNQDYQRTDNK